MGRRNRKRENNHIEAIGKLAVAGIVLAALAAGGFENFAGSFFSLLILIVLCMIALAAFCGIIIILKRSLSQAAPRKNPAVIHCAPRSRSETVLPPPVWTMQRIRETLELIDWYQFEKFCSSLLDSEGFEVERKGGASPDGGVDLVVTRNGTKTLVQCKHWRTWKVKEPVVRQMLGSMVDFEVNRGAIFTLLGWTQPALELAQKHGIGMVNGDDLAARAIKSLSESQLSQVLRTDVHHCPKCEAPMLWKTGDFKPFWGCSTYPRCRGILKHSGAR